MKAEHLNQRALAARAQVDYARLGRALRGEVPITLLDVARISAALHIPLPWDPKAIAEHFEV